MCIVLVYKYDPVPYKRKFAVYGAVPATASFAAQADGVYFSTTRPMMESEVNRVADEPIQAPRVRTEFPET